MTEKSNGHITFNKEFFIGINDINKKITDYYTVLKKLGKGGYGIVYEIENNFLKTRRACKVISKNKVNTSFEKEKEILIKVNHPNIVKLYDLFQDKKFYYLVMEECTGGELFDRIISHIQKKKMFSEKEAAKLIKQVLLALSYCHSIGICHRDLKPENLLFSSEDKDASLKLIDFGLSEKFGTSPMKCKVGTSYYVAPEVLKGSYDQRCDIWSLGTILYILLSGVPPFNGRNDQEIYAKVAEMKYDLTGSKWSHISPQAKDLISKMMCPQMDRYTAKECLNHPWFSLMESAKEMPPIEIDVDTLKNYVYSNKLKKFVISYIADRMDEDSVMELKKKFLAFDKDNNGTISFNELKNGLKSFNLSHKEIEEIFRKCDTDQSGNLDYTEFLASIFDFKNYMKDYHLQYAFLALDLNKNGKISKDELMTVLRIKEGEEKANCLAKLIEKIDINKDGEIDYKEFINMMSMEDLDN